MIPGREFLKIGGLTVTWPGFNRGLFARSGPAAVSIDRPFADQ
jgi:hypothetical protein